MAGRERRGGSDGVIGGGRPSVWDGTWEGRLLEIIYEQYKKALDALPLEDMPALGPLLLDAGVCFGFADPVTNIITNTIRFAPAEDSEASLEEPEPNGAKKRKRRTKRKARTTRQEILSKIFAGDAPSTPAAPTIAERSLNGLVTFLTSCFRYLSTLDALQYLCLARADLLVAVKLIEHDRCYRHKDEFTIRSHAVMTAIKCAAVSARLPNVDAFLSGSSALVSHLKLITQTLLAERCRRLSVQEIYRLSGLLKKPVKLKKSDNPMDFAARRFRQCDIDASFVEKVPGGLTNSLRGVLLDRIHAQYLKAISRLQMKDFRTRHHRGLLKAGYCFGPFNPVSNIIVNTIWYDTVFPATEGFEVDMICTMTRVESRSLDGLIKLLLVSISKMSEHDAMVYLLKNNLKPRKAIRMARQEGHDTFSWDDNAYKTAADAASHPQPEAYVEFVLHSLPMVQSAVKSLLKASYTLSSDEVLHLSRLLSPSRCNPTKSLEPNGELTKDTLAMLSSFKEEFISQQSFVRRKIEAALQKYKLTKGDRYELHIICGVNANVGKKRWMRDLKRQYSHVNFWASSKDGTCPTLFFAEFSNDEDSDNHQSFCYPVSFLSTHVRCCYCEFQGTRIVHPLKSYWGGAMDFQQMACGEHKLTNARIISHGKLMACPVGIFEEDYIYLDPSQDTNLVRDMNNASWELNLDWGDELRRIKPMRAASGDLQVAH